MLSFGLSAFIYLFLAAFDVMFLDVRLPHLDGDGVARYLKSVVGPNSVRLDILMERSCI